MHPEGRDPTDPREWLRRAQSNLLRAKGPHAPGVYLEDLCFDAQQAAEKAIKALLIHRRVEFPYVHDLAMLLTGLTDSGEKVPEEAEGAEWLTRFAVLTRYPGPTEPVTFEQHARAVAVAEAVVRWAEQRIEGGA